MVKPLVLSGENGLAKMGRDLLQRHDSRMLLITRQQRAEGTGIAIAKLYGLIDLGQILDMDGNQVSRPAHANP